MFAVPGWSVSLASLKRQTKEIIDLEPDPGGIDREVDDESTPQLPRKRKRGNGELLVTKDNVAELWETFIERGDGAKSQLQEPDPTEKGKRKKHRKQSKDSKHAGRSADTKENPCKQGEEDDKSPSPIRDAEKGSKKRRTQETKNESKMDRSKDSQSDHLALTSTDHPIDTPPAPGPPEIKLTPLQASMRQKLTSARFRHLNQTLYTTSSADSFKLFQESPEMFEEYHEGFRRQVSVWPENPVDTIIQELERRAKIRDGNRKDKGKGKGRDRTSGDNANDQQLQPLPRTDSLCAIADLGCGDAKLARTMGHSARKMKLRIVSYDLYSPNQFVTKADIANLPLQDGSIDVAIFCLALMGTNWIDFIEEAYRILRWKGELWISEIKSRFGKVTRNKGGTVPHKSSKGKLGKARRAPREEDDDEEVDITVEVDGQEANRKETETDVSAFVEVLRRRGFALRSDETAIDSSNKMFVTMHFVKRLRPTKGKGAPVSEAGNADQLRGEFGRHRTKTKFVEDDDDGQDIDEATVLKPCVYKLR